MNIIVTDLPHTIDGFTKKTVASDGDWYTIILNARLNNERQREAYEHEMEHIEAGDFDLKCTADEIEKLRHG